MRDIGVTIGEVATDAITGFEGVVDGIAYFSSGTVQVHIQPQGLKDGELIPARWFEHQQVTARHVRVLPAPVFKAATFQFGDQVRDTITGFQGAVVAISLWLHGCHRYTVMKNTLDRDGKVVDEVFDDSTLVLVAPTVAEPIAKPTGGPERRMPTR